MINLIRRTHIIRLVLRSWLFLSALAMYIFDKNSLSTVLGKHILISLIWLIFMVDMILRFFPSSFESMGCQKQFKKNYIPRKGAAVPHPHEDRAALIILLLWLALNGILGALYLAGVFDWGIMLLLILFYSVCDVICILFYCPFQSLIMKNRCCVSCRIYNWDFAMMFTPAFFLPSFYTWSLLLVALILLFNWELKYHCHPERFAIATNCALDCSRCTEHLCKHKKAIRSLVKKWQER